ncbi:MAG: immunoglobulin domain-containing protein [Allosphingosinicella sp.]|uniref:immunoglobulin domain-containing protein n=1 Tax=Allosphingosinicella sp. TaxID=2823234 RepID=UPI00392AC685
MDSAQLKEVYKIGIAAALALVSLCLVLLPSIMGIIQKPYTHTAALWIFFLSLPVAILLLIYAYYFAAFTQARVPIASTGVGNIAAFIAIVSLGVFLFGNILSDRTSPPRITSLSASSYTPCPGSTISLTAEAQDDDGDDLRWRWEVQPDERLRRRGARGAELTSTLRSAQWHVPNEAAAGRYTVVVTASDPHRSSSAQSIELDLAAARPDAAEDSSTAPCED